MNQPTGEQDPGVVGREPPGYCTREAYCLAQFGSSGSIALDYGFRIGP